MTCVQPEAFNEVAEGIFYTNASLVVTDVKTIEFLKQEARINTTKRARLCAHPSADATQHDMLIVSHQQTYVVPHRHKSKSESFIVLEGTTDILIFNNDGVVEKQFVMGPANSGLPFFYRMPKGKYHSLVIKSELLVFLESTIGPFCKEDMEEAPWAPASQYREDGKSYLQEVLASC